MSGWMGIILRVDLSSGKIEKEPLSKELGVNYAGGRGINVRLLYDEVKPGIDAFDPENRLIFGTGPLTGTMLPSGRINITSKSPLTGIYGESDVGGRWGTELKKAGYDGVIVKGDRKSTFTSGSKMEDWKFVTPSISGALIPTRLVMF